MVDAGQAGKRQHGRMGGGGIIVYFAASGYLAALGGLTMRSPPCSNLHMERATRLAEPDPHPYRYGQQHSHRRTHRRTPRPSIAGTPPSLDRRVMLVPSCACAGNGGARHAPPSPLLHEPRESGQGVLAAWLASIPIPILQSHPSSTTSGIDWLF